LGTVGGISPASCKMRRTCVSETPSALKRASRSEMRRVPYSGCSRFSAATASRFTVSLALGCRVTPLSGFGSSASMPPCMYSVTHRSIVCALTPNALATSVSGVSSASTSSTARTFSPRGYEFFLGPALRRSRSSCSDCFLPLRFFIAVTPSGLSCQSSNGERR
jgi:hypothetical protein